MNPPLIALEICQCMNIILGGKKPFVWKDFIKMVFSQNSSHFVENLRKFGYENVSEVQAQDMYKFIREHKLDVE